MTKRKPFTLDENILIFLRMYYRANGIYPHIAMIARCVGEAPETIWGVVERLQRNGEVEREVGKASPVILL